MARFPTRPRKLNFSFQVNSEASTSQPREATSRSSMRDERLRIASYISDPCMRRRVAHRLMRKIRFLVDQCAVRCGQQIAVVTATPTKTAPPRRRPTSSAAPGHILLSSASDSSPSKDPPQDSFRCSLGAFFRDMMQRILSLEVLHFSAAASWGRSRCQPLCGSMPTPP